MAPNKCNKWCFCLFFICTVLLLNMFIRIHVENRFGHDFDILNTSWKLIMFFHLVFYCWLYLRMYNANINYQQSRVSIFNYGNMPHKKSVYIVCIEGLFNFPVKYGDLVGLYFLCCCPSVHALKCSYEGDQTM